MTAKTELSAPKRRTRAEVQQLVAEFVSSGIRRSEFCQSRGLSFSTLDRHLKKPRWKRKRLRSSMFLLLRTKRGPSLIRQTARSAVDLFGSAGESWPDLFGVDLPFQKAPAPNRTNAKTIPAMTSKTVTRVSRFIVIAPWKAMKTNRTFS
jgi:hypothetical protein